MCIYTLHNILNMTVSFGFSNQPNTNNQILTGQFEASLQQQGIFMPSRTPIALQEQTPCLHLLTNSHIWGKKYHRCSRMKDLSMNMEINGCLLLIWLLLSMTGFVEMMLDFFTYCWLVTNWYHYALVNRILCLFTDFVFYWVFYNFYLLKN